MSDAKACPKCEGTMSAGFIVDQGYGMATASKWQDGAPVKTFWTLGGVKQDSDAQFEIATYRCDRCCYLESYAH